jgi:ADP-ribose pyrophosphatase YjhB (NUDIX family)
MLTFDQDNARFNYRVAGIAIDGDHVLIHRAEDESFWTMPGGRVEMREPSDIALCREMVEELGVEVTIERLLWVVENFFEYGGMHCHELAFYYLMTVPPGRRRADGESFDGLEEFFEGAPGVRLHFRWHPIAKLDELEILPSFLPEGLADLPEHVEHLVHVDR